MLRTLNNFNNFTLTAQFLLAVKEFHLKLYDPQSPKEFPLINSYMKIKGFSKKDTHNSSHYIYTKNSDLTGMVIIPWGETHF